MLSTLFGLGILIAGAGTPAGFVNFSTIDTLRVGNRCYRNAVLQVLLRLPNLSFCAVQRPAVNGGVPSLSNVLCTLQTTALTTTTPVVPAATLEQVNNFVGQRNPLFAQPHSQQDAGEFFQSLEGTLANELLASLGLLEDRARFSFSYFEFRPKMRPQYVDVSSGIETRGELLIDEDLFLAFPESLITEEEPTVVSLELLLDTHFGETVVEYGTPPRDHLSSKLIEHYPDYAYISIKRFAHVPVPRRLPHYVEFPTDGLRLNPSQPDGPTYRLVGYVNHVGGSIGAGHYTSVARQDDRWFKFDDTVVKEEEVLVTFSDQVYLLFYVRNKRHV